MKSPTAEGRAYGNVYDVETGAARNGTAPDDVYPVRVEDGVVTVTLPTC